MPATITATNKIATAFTADATSYETASLTPTHGRLYLCAVYSEATTASEPTVTGGGGLVWVLVRTLANGATQRISVFRALETTGLTSGTVTAAFGANTQTLCNIVIDEFAGVDTSGTDGSGAIVQSASATGVGTSSSVTLAAFGDATNNAAYGAVTMRVAEGVTPETGYTELGEAQNSDGATTETEWKVGEDTAVTHSWTTSERWLAVAVEIKAGLPTLSVSGAITPTSAVTNFTAKSLTATITPVGALTRKFAVSFAGTLALAGEATRKFGKALTGTIAFAGSLSTHIKFVLAVVSAGSLTLTPSTEGSLTLTPVDDGS